MPVLLIVVTMFFGGLTLALTGFAHALVSVPILSPVLGLQPTAALFSLVSTVAQFGMVLRYRRAFSWRAVWRVMLASLIAIPLGIMLIKHLDKGVMLVGLGLLMVSYGLYSLAQFPLPKLHNPNWGYPFGFVSGLLAGAYNTGGPPVVIYGTMSNWPKEEFKGNLQAFVVNTLFNVALHLLQGHLTAFVWQAFAIAMPSMLVGVLVGWKLEKYIPAQRFRQLVLVVLIILGLRLIFAS